jgi:hypothetical protein
MADQFKMTEKEGRLLEQLRLLKRQDSAFGYLPDALIDAFDVMVERGREYNGNAMGVSLLNFFTGDAEAVVHLKRPVFRAIEIVNKYGENTPEGKLKDKITDAINGALIWSCCRRERSDGLQNRDSNS